MDRQEESDAPNQPGSVLAQWRCARILVDRFRLGMTEEIAGKQDEKHDRQTVVVPERSSLSA